jgi:hypothetical protein
MEKYLSFIKKSEPIFDIDSEPEKENIEPSVYSVDSLSKEFFNENSPKVSVEEKEKRYTDFVKKSKSDIDSKPEQENTEPPVYLVDSLSKDFFNENSSNLRKRKVHFREFKINHSISSHIPMHNPYVPNIHNTYSQNNFPNVNAMSNILPVNKFPIIENYNISMQNPAADHIKITDLREKKVNEENINNEKIDEEKVEDEKIEEEKVEDKLLTRLIKSLMNFVNFTN